jgi:hypothetical protein
MVEPVMDNKIIRNGREQGRRKSTLPKTNCREAGFFA